VAGLRVEASRLETRSVLAAAGGVSMGGGDRVQQAWTNRSTTGGLSFGRANPFVQSCRAGLAGQGTAVRTQSIDCRAPVKEGSWVTAVSHLRCVWGSSPEEVTAGTQQKRCRSGAPVLRCCRSCRWRSCI
jgi:hypothetical protein